MSIKHFLKLIPARWRWYKAKKRNHRAFWANYREYNVLLGIRKQKEQGQGNITLRGGN
jgi:hypothetical protein